MTSAPTVLHKSFLEMLTSHVGKEFTIVNPQTFEESGVGHQIVERWYPSKLVAVGEDFIVLVGHFQHGAGKHAVQEPMEQYVPTAHIKRVTIMHSARMIHL
jgi:hypothetical protein